MTPLFSNLKMIVRALRVYQWTKNLLVLAALIFSRQFLDPQQVLLALLAFTAFCMASSATYLLNDLVDIENDRLHPKKRHRPIASGALKPPLAWAMLLVLFACSLALAWWIRPQFLLALLAYITLTVAYSFLLKQILIIDVMAVALGFVIRAIAGAVALNIVFSQWLVVCTFFLAMFLGLSKRRHELTLLDDGASSHRQVLTQYSVHFLDQLILIMAGGAIIIYTIYTCTPEVHDRSPNMFYTLPLVVYGLFRYLHLIHHKTGGGDPSSTLLTDAPLLITVATWGIACAVILYF